MRKKEQEIICRKFGSPFVESYPDMKVGISQNVKDGILPINGLRHPIEGETSGWYIWGGEELSEDPDFFMPVHVKHLGDWNPMILDYLALAPGWRFLITNNYEDVWRDDTLLNI